MDLVWIKVDGSYFGPSFSASKRDTSFWQSNREGGEVGLVLAGGLDRRSKNILDFTQLIISAPQSSAQRQYQGLKINSAVCSIWNSSSLKVFHPAVQYWAWKWRLFYIAALGTGRTAETGLRVNNAYCIFPITSCVLHIAYGVMVYGTAHCTLHLKMGKILRHFRNICTIKSFPMNKFERSDDSKLHPCIGCWWLLTATKNNQPTKTKS